MNTQNSHNTHNEISLSTNNNYRKMTIKNLLYFCLLSLTILPSKVFAQDIDYTKTIESFVDNDNNPDQVFFDTKNLRLEVQLSVHNKQSIMSKSLANAGILEQIKITETSNGFYFLVEKPNNEAKYIFHYDQNSKKMLLTGIEIANKENSNGGPYQISLYNNLEKVSGHCESQNKHYKLSVAATGFAKLTLEDFSDQKMIELTEKSLQLIKNQKNKP
jgi:hypothetical protein